MTLIFGHNKEGHSIRFKEKEGHSIVIFLPFFSSVKRKFVAIHKSKVNEKWNFSNWLTIGYLFSAKELTLVKLSEKGKYPSVWPWVWTSSTSIKPKNCSHKIDVWFCSFFWTIHTVFCCRSRIEEHHLKGP